MGRRAKRRRHGVCWLLGTAFATFAAQAQAAAIIVVPPAGPPIVVTTLPNGVAPEQVTSIPAISASVDRLAQDRINQFITTRVLSSILLGANEQVNGCNCISAFGAFGSVSGGVHGRYNLTDSLTILGGASVSAHRDGGANTRSSPTFAASFRYDPAGLGASRPFFEIGGIISPDEQVRYRRSYLTGAGPSAGSGNTTNATSVGFARAGYIFRLSPRDEFAVAADISRGWQHVGSYNERASFSNAFPAFVGGGTDTVNIAKFGGQYTRLVTDRVEVTVSGGAAYAFDQRSGLGSVAVGGIAMPRPTLRDVAFFEGGARVGYRIADRAVIDTFVVSAVGAQPIGSSVHGGVGLRYDF